MILAGIGDRNKIESLGITHINTRYYKDNLDSLMFDASLT